MWRVNRQDETRIRTPQTMTKEVRGFTDFVGGRIHAKGTPVWCENSAESGIAAPSKSGIEYWPYPAKGEVRISRRLKGSM